MTYPRLLYRGGPGTAEYKRVSDDAEFLAATRDGWRVRRVPEVPEVKPEWSKPPHVVDSKGRRR